MHGETVKITIPFSIIVQWPELWTERVKVLKWHAARIFHLVGLAGYRKVGAKAHGRSRVKNDLL